MIPSPKTGIVLPTEVVVFWSFKTVPVFLAGMWPSSPGQPSSGTKVSLLEKEGGPLVLEGFSDEAGDFRGRLPTSWSKKELLVVVHDASFKQNYFNPVKVERWGLFLAIRQEKDLNYSGSQGAKSRDPVRWDKWNPTQEHIRASQRISAAVRLAKIDWPLRLLGTLLAVAVGIAGFFVHPAIGLVLGLLSYFLMELLTQYLLNRGY